MSDERAERIADFIGPLRVNPGATVRLERDFDPRHKAGLRKRDGIELLRTGVSLPAEYQERLTAQDTYGVLLCLQAARRPAAGCCGSASSAGDVRQHPPPRRVVAVQDQ
ncbi:hypothetical protein OG562_33695 [Streptomyces sp. NBC_01275]|uniref:hypothetical protein n=1 Tax=Streptomyces sp. NBC_01275 TaxID=2903807 RepID=UPI0022552901|nr:hypothetical protein [Streptomyces sp. NBC_01275]MCX4765846.1 hypothetical protein [Streptomyces sp. NBC_01275]